MELVQDRQVCSCEIDISGVHYASASNTFPLKSLVSSRFSIHIHGTFSMSTVSSLGARQFQGRCREGKSLEKARVPCFCSRVRSVLNKPRKVKNTLKCSSQQIAFWLELRAPILIEISRNRFAQL